MPKTINSIDDAWKRFATGARVSKLPAEAQEALLDAFLCGAVATLVVLRTTADAHRVALDQLQDDLLACTDATSRR